MTVETQTDQKRKTVAKQLMQAAREGKVDCSCGKIIPTHLMYRCLYCGEFYCQKCAEDHFGKTRQKYMEEKNYQFCPMCGESLIFPRGSGPYCEECGYEVHAQGGKGQL